MATDRDEFTHFVIDPFDETFTMQPWQVARLEKSFHLGRAREAYVHGLIDVDTFERMVEHALDGGTLPECLDDWDDGLDPIEVV